MKTPTLAELVWPSSNEEVVQRRTEDSSSISNSRLISRITSPSSRHCRKGHPATFTALQTATTISTSCTINCRPMTSSVDSAKAGLGRPIETGTETLSRSERLSLGKSFKGISPSMKVRSRKTGRTTINESFSNKSRSLRLGSNRLKMRWHALTCYRSRRSRKTCRI